VTLVSLLRILLSPFLIPHSLENVQCQIQFRFLLVREKSDYKVTFPRLGTTGSIKYPLGVKSSLVRIPSARPKVAYLKGLRPLFCANLGVSRIVKCKWLLIYCGAG
jgi:hypothetical protein